MPTITITSTPLTVPRRRAVAVRLTRWLRDRGVTPAHVIVHFTDHRPDTVFSGGLPVELITRTAAGLPYASVVCRIGPDRDAAFRAGLAEQIAAALEVRDPSALLYIEFRPTGPDHVHVWRNGALRRADSPLQPEEREHP
jgi:hypothetical protein